MAYEPFIDDPEHIRAVDRQRFVVLRPATVIREIHAHVQALLRQHVPDLLVSYPAQAHVTLGAFGVGTHIREVQDLVESWSHKVAALRITVERLTYFPAPSQTLIIRVLNTPELVGLALKSRQDMPEISRFLGIVIGMFYEEHGVAHFHAVYGEYEASVEVESGKVHGELPPRALRFVLEWAALHKKELLDDWQRARHGEPLEPIAPLE